MTRKQFEKLAGLEIKRLKEDYQLTIIDENDAAFYINYALTKKRNKDVLDITYWEASY